ncbi:MAG: pyridoxamine 5'-phosphate oxidase family protein [Deltaproteobacteria bacterium]|nr:pyridoxamine 5'-phosphate oxidase family protein [Deltaproteobacteria bacterium]
MVPLAATARTTLKRLPKRGSYDRAAMYRILDEALVCHVGFAGEGSPVVIPTAYGRSGDTLLLHGSAAGRMLRTVAGGVDVCVTVTLVDGLVLARSAFHHSINYRSVVIFGRARVVDDAEGKRAALRAITEHIVPGRWADVREPHAQELKATLVLALALEEASVKTRSGPPLDDEEDYTRAVWAGELPLRVLPQAPVADARLVVGVEPPPYVRAYRRPGSGSV